RQAVGCDHRLGRARRLGLHGAKSTPMRPPGVDGSAPVRCYTLLPEPPRADRCGGSSVSPDGTPGTCPMKIAVPRETAPGETRVALTPAAITGLVGDGVDVVVQSGAGDASFLGDEAFREAGASI